MSLSLREFAKQIGTSPSTLCRMVSGKDIEYATLQKILSYYDPDLAEEVDALMNYVRKALGRRSKKGGGPA